MLERKERTVFCRSAPVLGTRSYAKGCLYGRSSSIDQGHLTQIVSGGSVVLMLLRRERRRLWLQQRVTANDRAKPDTVGTQRPAQIISFLKTQGDPRQGTEGFQLEFFQSTPVGG